MHAGKKALLAAGLLAGASMLTGCSAGVRPAVTPTTNAQQVTAAPATAQPAADASAVQDTETAGSEDASGPIPVSVEGKALSAGALREGGKLLLPLAQTAEALGWKAQTQQTGDETQTKRVVTLEKDESRITVSWTVSDNTAKGITWQKDGLLVPVDTYLTTADDVVYAPAAFFEEAMDAAVQITQKGVSVATVEPADTPQKQVQESDGNG